METVEILAGGSFTNAVEALDLTSAKCTYHYRPDEKTYREDYQVWLLSKEDFDNICAIDDADWKEDWGWWRHSSGSVLGTPSHDYTLNGAVVVAWDGAYREDFYENECMHCSEHVNNGGCAGEESDQEECYRERAYADLLCYINEEVGASTETNICAVCIDLAKYNDMTLSELFKKYLGGENNESN